MSRRLRLIALDVVMALAAINIWTGSPLLALWIGSRLSESSRPSMGAVFVVIVVMLGCSLLLIRALSVAGAAHDRLLGRPPPPRHRAPWLRAMTAERPDWERARSRTTMLERICVIAVVLATVAFEVWFFFFSGSSI